MFLLWINEVSAPAVQTTMPFNSELIKVSKVGKKAPPRQAPKVLSDSNDEPEKTNKVAEKSGGICIGDFCGWKG